MNKIKPLGQKRPIGADALNHSPKLQIKIGLQDSILARLVNLASAVPDFRRTGKGNLRHRLEDVILLIVLARMSGCIVRADIIEFGRHNLRKFQKMGLLMSGVPSEPTLCRIEKGIDDLAFAERMREYAQSFHAKVRHAPHAREIICIDGKAERGTVQENGRNPDIVSAYSHDTGIVLATEACEEKSNEIKAVPRLIDKIDINGKIVTADAMSMQKDIIDKIRAGGGDFIIELKANQRALRYGVEDRLKMCHPAYTRTEGPVLAHGRIETRKHSSYDGLELIADKDKWGGNLTIIEYESATVNKATGVQTSQKRLYVSSLPADMPLLGSYVRSHWSIESMHWGLDVNLLQDRIKRKSAKAARNLDTIQRIIYSTFSIWKRLRKKRSDKRKGIAQIMRSISKNFTKLIQFLSQK